MKKRDESKMKPRLQACSRRRRAILSKDIVSVHGEDLRWKDKPFVLGHAEFQTAMGYPRRNVSQAVSYENMNGRGEFWSRKIKLSIFSVEVILNAVGFDMITRGKM